MSAAFVLALFPAAARGQDASARSLSAVGLEPALAMPPAGRARLVAAWFVVGARAHRSSRPAASFRGAHLASLREPRATPPAPERRLPLILESPADPGPPFRGLGWMLAAGLPEPAAPALLTWALPPPDGEFDPGARLDGPLPASLVWDRRIGRIARDGAWWPQVSTAGARADIVGSARGLTSRLLGVPGASELGWSVGGGAGVDRQPASAALDSEAPLPPDALVSATGLLAASAWVTRRRVDGRLSLTGSASWLQILDADTAALAGLARARYLGAALRFSPTPAVAAGLECQVGAREGQAGAVGADGRLQMSTRIRF